jgi:hypothetical protein
MPEAITILPANSYTLHLHKSGKEYRRDCRGEWTHPTKGVMVGVHGRRNGKDFGPWRAVPLASLVKYLGVVTYTFHRVGTRTYLASEVETREAGA